MAPRLESLHHVTATVADPHEDVAFHTGLLGLRLVKRTVNFDDPTAYHLYYGDERGTPGSIMTTFPYGGRGLRRGTRGAGQITTTSFSIPPGAVAFWEARLETRGVDARRGPSRLGHDSLFFYDPSGLEIELVETRDERGGWPGGGVDPAAAIRGVYGVTITVGHAAASTAFLTEVLGGRVEASEGARTRVEVGEGGPGSVVELVEDPAAPRATDGIGTVHHVAFCVADDEAQAWFRTKLLEAGAYVTDVRDREYFRSIYFREPGGVLFEIATAAPGFFTDESDEELGTGLRLPPWEEPNRASIEAALSPL